MLHVYPDYYTRFQCLADRCRHNCCIGWEIDIDGNTAAFYNTLSSPLGERLRANITTDDPPHFLLDEKQRCPFLNQQNLCDVITKLGEEHLCDVCYFHPRFHNEFPERIEMGLGLSCEAAGALILGQREPTILLYEGENDIPDPRIVRRDELIRDLQDRTRPLDRRLPLLSQREMEEWTSFFCTLEQLDPAWEALLKKTSSLTERQLTALQTHMAERETEYEQLAVYLLYRHYALAATPQDAAARAALPTLICSLLRYMGAVVLAETDKFTFDDQVELARLFSSEIEYSDENPQRILRRLETNRF